MRNINLLLTFAALLGFAQPAAAGEERLYFDITGLPSASEAPGAGTLALSPYQRNLALSNQQGSFGVTFGYALPHETGEWRIAAGVTDQPAVTFDSPQLSPALRSETADKDTTAMVSMLYAFDVGEEGLFGMNLQPYVGGGVGLTRNPGDYGSGSASGLNSDDNHGSNYNLSWGLTAGVNMPLASNLNLSLAYRYVGQGEGDGAAQARDDSDIDKGAHNHDLMLIFGLSF